MKFEKSCGGIVCIDVSGLKKYLLIQHRVGGHWSFPKGHMEKNETEIQTAMREIKEETNLDVVICDNIFASTVYFPKKDIIKQVVYFLAVTNMDEVILQDQEVTSYLWATAQEVGKYLTFENDYKIFKMLINE